MTGATSGGGELDSLVGRVADEFLARLERGEWPDPEEYAARHPEAAELLRRALGALRVVGDSLPGRVPGPDPVANALPPEPVGDFRIVREVGRGGMGVVYEAEQISLRRRVALKVLPFVAVMDPRRLQRFRNEALAAAALDHPHAVKVYAVGQDRGVHYIAMQFVNGRPLADLIRERQGATPARATVREAAHQDPTHTHAPDATADGAPIVSLPTPASGSGSKPPADRAYARRVAGWGVQAAEALEHAHALGVVHRDVKPGNLLVDARGELFVADFGLARVTGDPGVTGTGDLLGTLRYMSPEQAGAKHNLVDHRSDVYSLGVTLYELLTLTPAFAGESQVDVLRKIADEEPSAPRKLDKHIPRDLETVILKAMAKDPAGRYQSAKELADDLRRFLADEPVRAQRVGPLGRAGKFVRRNRGPVMAVSLIVLALVGGIVGTTLGLLEAERQAGIARDDRDRAVAAEREAQDREEKATEAREEAERQTKLAQEVSRFLQDVFTQVDAADQTKKGRSADPNISVRAAMDNAGKEIDRRFDGQPLLEAEVRFTLGKTYFALHDYQAAVTHFARAADLRRDNLGALNPRTLGAQDMLAYALNGAVRRAEAVQLRQHLVEATRTAYGPADPRAVGAMRKLAELSGSVEDMRKALAAAREHLGDRHGETLICMSFLALKLRTDAFPESEALSKEIIRIKREVHGDRHPDTLGALGSLGTAYSLKGRNADAEALLTETHAGLVEACGVDDHRTLNVQGQLAAALNRQGKHDRGVPLLRQLLDANRRINGDTHPTIFYPLRDLADLHLKLNQADQAEALARGVLTALEKSDPDHPQTFLVRAMVGNVLRARKRYAEAEPLLVGGYEGFVVRAAAAPTAQRRIELNGARGWVRSLYTETKQTTKAEAWLARTKDDHLKLEPAPGAAPVVAKPPAQAQATGEAARLRPGAVPGAAKPPALFRASPEAEAADLVFLASAALKAKQNADALGIAQMAVALAPNSAATHRALIDVFQATRKWGEAAGAYGELIRLEPNSWRHHGDRGDLYLHAGRSVAAAADFDRAIDVGPNQWHLYKRRALARFNLGDYPAALGDLTRAVDLNPDDFSNLTWIYPERVVACPDAAFRNGLLDLATRTIERTGKKAEARAVRVRLYAAMGEAEKADAACDEAIRLHPTDATLYRLRSDMHLLRRRYAAAAADLTRAAELVPTEWHVFARRAVARFHLGEYPAALDDFARSVELNPVRAVTLNEITVAEVAACTDAGFRRGMLDLATRAIEQTGDNPDVSAFRAGLYDSLGETEKARADWENAAAWYDQDPVRKAEVLALLGHSLLRQGKYADADPILRECLAIREKKLPDSWLRFNALSMLGGTLLRQGKYADAEPLLLRGYEGMKRHAAAIPYEGRERLPETIGRLVQLYEALDQPERAAEWQARMPPAVAPPPRPVR